MKQVENLQLLYSLLEVFNAQSLSEAAKKLGKTTSAVSKDLSKLREQLDDPLFIRSNNRMLPTEYASSIAPTIERLLIDISHTISSKNTISTEHYNKPIKVAITHMIMDLYGDEISVQLSNKFPNASIELLTWDSASNQQLQEGIIDFGIHSSQVSHPGKIRYRRMITYDLAVTCSEKDKYKTLDKLAKENEFMFLKVKDWNDTETILNSIANRNDINLNYTHFVDNLATAIKIVKRKNLCFIILKVIAEYHDLHYISWPLENNRLTFGLYYNTHQNELLTNELYNIVASVLKSDPTSYNQLENLT
ncbi:LysR family transcriptional regulator [Vibrio sp. ZSDZ65]|uniref:LysR family transcriptional regulator n=1 Tax=Vibrio qingdaonensis TaxID=2829491 RepID=A0A9X3HWB4_9VIBR|nr:LysR family transcriptional regulator [Vibrio qingdaonensis]MCW8346445.1 LysR family transcriptional regulator [Vibrio qingdaonensis]